MFINVEGYTMLYYSKWVEGLLTNINEYNNVKY